MTDHIEDLIVDLIDQHSAKIDYDKLAAKTPPIDYDKLASKISYIALADMVRQRIGDGGILANVIRLINACDVASLVDLKEIASYIDLGKLATHIDSTQAKTKGDA
jgi:hypothetical protein